MDATRSPTIQLLNGFGDFARFGIGALAASGRPPWRARLILEQCYLIGVRAMPVAMLTALFVGMVIILQGAHQLAEFNATQYAAGGAARALTQVMIPIFTALVVGARTAASIAAELGTMRVTEQIDALEVLEVNPRGYLIVPRVIASTLTLPVIVAYGDVVGVLGGMLMGHAGFGIPYRYYLSITFDFMRYSDVAIGLIKTFFFGLAIGICGCYFGFRAEGGAEGVGRATTRAVVTTLIALILLEYLLTTWMLYALDTFFGSSLKWSA